MLTKQHFEAIASIIKAQVEAEANPKTQQRIEWLTYDLADYFAQQNEHFSHIRFINACGFKA